MQEDVPKPAIRIAVPQGVTAEHFKQVLELTDPLAVTLRGGSLGRPGSKYSPIIHGELCRFKILGLSDAECAKAVGITTHTLRAWFSIYPMLESDLRQAETLAVASVANILQQFMREEGPVGLNAVKFFLSTHSKSFRERGSVAVTVESGNNFDNLVKRLYGVEIKADEDRTNGPGDNQIGTTPEKSG